MSDSEEKEFDEAMKRDEEKKKEEDPPDFVRPERALKRWDAGSPQWYDNQYTVQRLRRERSDAYKQWQKENWEANGARYSEQRKKRRQEALQAMKDLGLPVSERKDGLLTMKVGRPCVPQQAMLVPLNMIRPIEMNDMTLLGEPDLLKDIKDYIDVPEKYEDSTFDLQGYLQLKQILIPKSVLKWGMFHFKTWDEQRPKGRANNVGNARRAMSNDVVDYVKAHKELADTLFYYNPKEDEWIDKLNNKADSDEEEEKPAEPEQKIVPASGRKRLGKEKANNFTQNPLRIVQFMVEVNMDPWKVVLGTCETTQANSKATGLASCCYAYLRFLWNEKKQDTPLFKKVLYWSFIFGRYTTVSKKQTAERHASQLTSEEKIKSTEEWGSWQQKAFNFLSKYFIITDTTATIRTKKEGYKPYFPLPGGLNHKMRVKRTTLDDGSKHNFEPELLPWWRPDYNEKRRVANSDDRPNLRELRDCAMLAVYSFLAPIRLDWATCVLMSAAGLNSYKAKKADAEKAEIVAGQVVKKRGVSNKNILEVDDAEKPTQVIKAYFGQMKNINAFQVRPVPKDLDRGVGESEHNPKHKTLARNILTAFLKERVAKGYKSDCLFPYSTEKSDELNADGDVCFENSSFGDRLATLSHLLTGKNFTETLMRRSYITWFWKQPGNDPLNEQHWKRLLPNVHQNSKSANLGYIKEYNEEIQKEVDKYRLENKLKGATPPEVIERIRSEQQRKVLEREGMLEGAANFNPEEDKDDEKSKKRAQEELKEAIKEQADTKKEIQVDKKKIEEVIQLRQSSRLQARKKEEPPVQPQAPKAARGKKKSGGT